jgi:hypothetical protein
MSTTHQDTSQIHHQTPTSDSVPPSKHLTTGSSYPSTQTNGASAKTRPTIFLTHLNRIPSINHLHHRPPCHAIKSLPEPSIPLWLLALRSDGFHSDSASAPASGHTPPHYPRRWCLRPHQPTEPEATTQTHRHATCPLFCFHCCLFQDGPGLASCPIYQIAPSVEGLSRGVLASIRYLHYSKTPQGCLNHIITRTTRNVHL